MPKISAERVYRTVHATTNGRRGFVRGAGQRWNGRRSGTICQLKMMPSAHVSPALPL
jgi:hypothetical protein